ncbi:hypothetical protein ACEWY4_012259 [Coilia grayii]|uniref:V-SNARE coiled-coil homology domain-containing protein n=1 Tax=Coilia grayii TaxID=363190 RepID=A0ABD1K056_9TELE
MDHRDNPSVMQGGNEKEAAEMRKLPELNSRVEEVKDLMTKNIENIIARETKLDDLSDQADAVRREAKVFSETSQKVAHSYCWKNVKVIVAIIVVVLIIVLIIILLATGVIPVSNPVPPPPTSKP